jgi:hypothetical protein
MSSECAHAHTDTKTSVVTKVVISPQKTTLHYIVHIFILPSINVCLPVYVRTVYTHISYWSYVHPCTCVHIGKYKHKLCSYSAGQELPHSISCKYLVQDNLPIDRTLGQFNPVHNF